MQRHSSAVASRLKMEQITKIARTYWLTENLADHLQCVTRQRLRDESPRNLSGALIIRDQMIRASLFGIVGDS